MTSSHVPLNITDGRLVPPLHPIERKRTALDGGRPGLKGLGKIKSTPTQRSTTPTRAKTARVGYPRYALGYPLSRLRRSRFSFSNCNGAAAPLSLDERGAPNPQDPPQSMSHSHVTALTAKLRLE